MIVPATRAKLTNLQFPGKTGSFAMTKIWEHLKDGNNYKLSFHCFSLQKRNFIEVSCSTDLLL